MSWCVRPIWSLLSVVLIALGAIDLFAQDETSQKAQRFIRSFCTDCHSTADRQGDREFESLDLNDSGWDTQLKLQELIDQITLGAMPPPEATQPNTDQRLEALQELTQVLGEMRERSSSTGGKSVLRRLTRREYRNTVGDLLSIDMTMFDPTMEFPADNLSDHADNIGDALVTSGYLLEKYLDAADRCIEKAFAAAEPPEPREWVFKDKFLQQVELNNAHRFAHENRYLVLYDHPLNTKPEGAYGPLMLFGDGVPADGIYEIKVLAEALNRDTPYSRETVLIDLEEPFRLGVRPGDTSIGDMTHVQPLQPLLAEAVLKDRELGWYTFNVPLSKGFAPRFTFENGMHDTRGAYGRVFKNDRDSLPENVRNSQGIVEWRKNVMKFGYLPQIRIHEVRMTGPLPKASNTGREEWLIGSASFEATRVPELIRRFATRAYRRAVTEEEVASLCAVYERRRADGRAPFEAYKDALKAALCSPAFLYLGPPNDAQEASLSDHRIAERLAYFLTSSMPDNQLRKLADEGQLAKAEVLKAETRRLLESPKSDRFIADFLDSWLNLRALGSMPPDEKASRVYYAAGLEPEMKQETRLFTRDLISRNASVLEYLRADYSFANRDLAKLYGVADQVPLDDAAGFHRVRFANRDRGGLLGQASVLTVSANGIETSPVIRGIWLMETILGAPVPPPPDVVPALDPDVRGAVSIRDQLAKHRESPACNQCHRKFDPLGFALEGFDPIGRKREFYDSKRKLKIDTSGVLPSGESFSGVEQLRSVVLQREEFFVRTITSRLLSHALGRRMEATDRPAIDRIVAEVKDDDYRFVDLIVAVVASDTFHR